MKFFDELPLDELQVDDKNLTENQKTEKLVLETINEMIKKINDVQFIGHANVFRLANEAIGKIDPNNKEAIEKDFTEMREAVKGLRGKLEAENDINIRVQLTELAKSERFIPAMQKIIAQGQGTAEEKEAMQAKLQAFIDAQNSTQGYGSLCARDLVLVIQMIETLMQTIKEFQRRYYSQITKKNNERLEELQNHLMAAQNPILKSVINLLELNEPQFRETKLAASNIVPGMVDSMVNVSVVELPPQDTAQVLTNDINDILKKNSKNPKLIQSPHLIQDLDETPIPKNILSIDEDATEKNKNIKLREFLTQYRIEHTREKKEQASWWDAFIAIPGKLYEYFMDAAKWLTWKNSVSQNLASYFASYFYSTGDDKPAQVDDKQAQANQKDSASLPSYCYQTMQNIMDVVWHGLGYSTASKAESVIEHYEETIAPIKAKYETPPPVDKKEKKVRTLDQNLTTPTQSAYIPDIDHRMQQKYQPKPIPQVTRTAEEIAAEAKKQKHLQDEYSQVYKKYKNVVAKLNLYLGNSKRVMEHLKIKVSPSKQDIIELKQITTEILIKLSQGAVNINLLRKADAHKRAEARDIEASMKPLLKIIPSESNYEKLFKETLSLCFSYSTKLIKPAPQRIKAINWLYHVLHNLNENQKISDQEKYEVLKVALYKVLEESDHHHVQTSFFGACGLNNSKLASKISDLFRKYGIQKIRSDDVFAANKIDSYEDFEFIQTRRASAARN